MAVSTYHQSEVKFSVFGIPVTDIPQDAEITVEYDEDKITKTIDCSGGGGIFSVRDSTPAKITVPILPNSRWVAILNGYMTSNKMMPVILKDMNDYAGATSYVSAHAMLQRTSGSYGAEATNKEYTFEVIQLLEATLPV